MTLTRLVDRPSRSAAWQPAVDIRELADRYLLTADLPGVDPEAIDVSLEDNVLTLAGRRNDTARDGSRRHRAERASGEFLRRFALPGSVDGDAISARSERGTLEVTLPKRAAARVRRVDVAAV